MTFAITEKLKHSKVVLAYVAQREIALTNALNKALDMIGREGSVDSFEVQVSVELHPVDSDRESGISAHELIWAPAGTHQEDPKYAVNGRCLAIVERCAPEIVRTAARLLDQLIGHVGYDLTGDESEIEERISGFFKEVEEDVKLAQDIEQAIRNGFGAPSGKK